jgi:hypothetical protein
MGRKKITIEPITDERNRHVTFNKRKSGLIKKAMELSILCNCQISFLVFNAENQLFEYCSTDPRLILQQYCKVAHLPHERLSNADYSRFDKASRGTKGGRGKKASGSDMGNSNSIANESSNDMSNQGMSQHSMKQEEGHMPQRRQSISFMDQQQMMMQQPIIQVHQPQYSVDQQNAQHGSAMAYADPHMMQQVNPQINQQLLSQVELLTPVTPNTVEQIMMNQAMSNGQEEAMQQHTNQIGFQQHMMDQVAAMRSDKRKYDQMGDEEFSEPKRQRHGANLAPLQVPSNPAAMQMRRVEGPSDEQAQQYNENWQQQQHQQQQTNASGDTGGEFTPLGGFLFSPLGAMGNLSTPMAMGVVDWNSKGKDQSST